MTPKSDEMVLVAVKTPLMPQATTALLPGGLTLAQALDELRRTPPKDSNGARVLQQLERETLGRAFDFLALKPTGQVAKVEPSTTLREIAVPREIRTPQGLETIPAAAFEVQAYAPVGGSGPC